MTLAKMLRILEMLETLHGHLPSGEIDCSGGGELRLCFRSQPSKEINDYLRKKGFVLVDTYYLYRPI